MFKKLNKKAWRFKFIGTVKNIFLPIFLGGLIGALVTASIFIWPTVYGANWWEVLTAIGTVTSAFFAVWIANHNKIYYEKERKDNARRYLASACVDLKKAHGFFRYIS